MRDSNSSNGFRGILVSGHVKLLKPDARIYQAFLQKFAIDPAHTIYIDDRRNNVDAAIALGMPGIIVFTDAFRRHSAPNSPCAGVLPA